jgi:hypothetical protein
VTRPQPLAVLLGAVVSAAAGSLAAQQPAEPSAQDRREARRLFEEGVAAVVNDGDCATALEKFRASYALNPRPVVLFNMGACQQATGDLRGALESLEEYLETGGEEITPEQRVQVERMVADVERQLTNVDVTVNVPGATILVNGVLAGTSPLLAPVHVDPGTAEVTARKEGYQEATTVVVVPAGETVTVELTLREMEEPPPPPPPPPPPDGEDGDFWSGIWQEWWFWTAVGGVVAGVSLGVGLGVGLSSESPGYSPDWIVWGR